jgi:hypothetical protein
VQHVMLYHTKLCLELSISIKSKYTKIRKVYLGYIEKLYKRVDFVLRVLKVLNDALKIIKVIKNY